MKSNYLFPHRFKKIGWFILIPTIIIGILSVISEWEPPFLDVRVFALFIDDFGGKDQLMGFANNNILNEILGVLMIVSSILVAFSKEKNEDEFIANIRLKSLVWATYWNYGILLVAFLLLYDFSFYWVMVFNMFTILILFILKFNWSVWKLEKLTENEE